MHRNYLLSLVLSLSLAASFLAACQTNTAVPRFENADCPFTKPQSISVSCGYLVVPEVRPGLDTGGPAQTPSSTAAAAAANQKTIRLAVAIFKSTASNPPADPIVYLEGGPGSSPLESYADNVDQYFGPFLAQRDLILVDQRGTGYSTPALNCPQFTQAEIDALPLNQTAAQSDAAANAAFQACHDQLVKDGDNLAAYNSAESAADFADLRQALGYKEWNLYGISYGTRLALTIERDHPEGLRSAVIDSVLPPNVDLIDTQPDNTARALNQLFDACAADSTCNAAYPNLKTVFYDTATKLDAKPVTATITLPDVGISGLAGRRMNELINGDGFISSIWQAMYVTSYLSDLPQVIYDASQGNVAPISQIDSVFLTSEKDMSWGMYASVQCYEETPFASEPKLAADIQAHPELGGSQGSAQGPFDMCKDWNLPSAPALEDQPVKSSVPTLVLSNQFDPVTPPAWGQLAASTLSQGTFVLIPAAGHGSSLTEMCPRRLALSFFTDPSTPPDSSCTKDMKVAFATPNQKPNVTLAPLTDSTLGITGLVPANWRTLNGVPGFYSPNGDPNDPEQIIIEALPLAPADFLNQVDQQFSSQGVYFNPTGKQRASPVITYTLYSASYGLTTLDMALGELNNSTYAVLMQAPFTEHDGLYQAIFLPVIDALRPQ